MNKPITLQGFVCNSWSKRSVRIMKISLILCLMALQITASNVYSQYVNLKLSVKNTTVAAVISSITHQTGYEFSYDAELLNKQIKNVSVSAKNERIENVLTELFKDTGIGFKILDNRVFLIENFEKNKTSENKTAEVQQKQKSCYWYNLGSEWRSCYWGQCCSKRILGWYNYRFGREFYVEQCS